MFMSRVYKEQIDKKKKNELPNWVKCMNRHGIEKENLMVKNHEKMLTYTSNEGNVN